MAKLSVAMRIRRKNLILRRMEEVRKKGDKMKVEPLEPSEAQKFDTVVREILTVSYDQLQALELGEFLKRIPAA